MKKSDDFCTKENTLTFGNIRVIKVGAEDLPEFIEALESEGYTRVKSNEEED